MAITWIKSYRKMAHHPRVEDLADALGVGMAQTIGHLHMLWWWAVDYAPDGKLNDFTDAKVARGAGWDGEPWKFMNALTECHFVDDVDGGVVLHEWDKHMGALFRESENNAARCKRYRGKKTTACRDMVPDKTRQDKTRQDHPRQDESVVHDDDDAGVVSTGAVTREIPIEFDLAENEMPRDDRPYPMHELEVLTKMYELTPKYKPDIWREARFAQDLVALYPSKDIVSEFVKALGWLKDNPERARDMVNLRQFLRKWVDNAEASDGRVYEIRA